jgi:hypothetical protein
VKKPIQKDYFYDDVQMLKMPMQLDKVSIKSNASHQIKIWDNEAKMIKLNPPK